MAAYATHSDVSSLLGITLTTAEQTLVTTLIAAVQSLVDRYCNRTWNTGANDSITELFDGGVDAFLVANPPIASVTSITVDGEALIADDYFVYDGYVRISYKVGTGNQNVVIVYKTDATAVPADVKQALVMWVAQMFRDRQEGGKATSSITTGPVSVNFLTKDGMPGVIKEILDLYRLPVL